MGREYKSLSWNVVYHDVNADQIKYYDILKYRQDFIKKLKKKCATKEEFAEQMRREMMWAFWSKAEWELIIEIDENNRVWLSPWVGSYKNERVDVTDREDFDWRGFASEHIGKQIYKNSAKVDVFDQLQYRWGELIDYCWHNRMKYERDNPKFHKNTEVNYESEVVD